MVATSGHHSGVVLAVVAAFTACLSWTAMTVNMEITVPYMDEVFHLPQARNYCLHNFTHWDPMITTLPGLYLFSVLVLEPLAWVTGFDTLDVCSLNGLRSLNVLFNVGTFLLLYSILLSYHRTLSLLRSLTLVCYPLLFFFSFLYYTDPGSTFFVLLAYWLSLRQYNILSAMSLFVAILFRQTNVVWVVFVSGTTTLGIVEPEMRHLQEKNGGHENVGIQWLLLLVRATFQRFMSLVYALWPHLLVVAAFVAFVVVNGSIVVGDKSHHTASLHFPQLYYFCSLSCAFAAGPIILSHTSTVVSTLRAMLTTRGMAVYLLMCVVGFTAVHYFTYEHPFLLADNRHYPFYLWKNIFRYHYAVKYVLVPVHCACMVVMGRLLAEAQSGLWLFLYLACCVVTLVPQALLEFRYYIIPYLLFRIHSPRPSLLGTVAELVTYTAINMATLFLFLRRPFLWPDTDQLQRFMW